MTKFSSPSVRSPLPAEAKPVSATVPPVCADTGTLSGRSVPEWKGRTPDSRIPPHVRMRVFLAYDGRCYLTGRKIMPADHWELDHITALINGGLHSESNLAPVLRDAHRIKTKADVREKAKIARMRKKHHGIKPDRSIRAWRKFDGTAVYAPRQR